MDELAPASMLCLRRWTTSNSFAAKCVSTSGRLQEFTRSSILAFECNWSEASLERELADHPECGLFCCIVWLTLLQLPRKTVPRFQLPSSGVGAGVPHALAAWVYR